MIQVYFDNEPIDEDYYSGLTNNFELFGSSFKLGTTAGNIYKLTVDKQVISTHPSEVKIYDETELIATLTIDNIEEDDYSYIYTLTDKMVNLEFYYDASAIFNNNHTTLLAIAQDICQKAGIELATQDFRGYDKNISWYDNTRTARQYIGYIAELNGGYAQIGTDGRLYFLKQKQQSSKTISIDDCADFKIGEKKKYTRVVYELGALKYEFGDETGNTLYLDPENVFITKESEVEGIYEDINNFEFYNFETSNCPIDSSIRAGNIVTFIDEQENEYPTIIGYDLTYSGGWYGGYKLVVNSEKQEETKVIGTEAKIRDLKIIVDRDEGLIRETLEEVDSQNEKIADLTLTVGELNSKISDATDTTVTKESNTAVVTLEEINASEPVTIQIRPLGTNISYLYPRDNLYPSDTLFMPDRIIRFRNTSTNEVFDWELPDDILYYDADNYDEFYMDYTEQVCRINKKVGYNADGTTYVLSTPTTRTFTYPSITLTEGDYEVSLPGYNSAYLFVRLMSKNIYTAQFVTRVEEQTDIRQTANSINLSVDQKLTNYSTTSQMNAAIDIKANQITNTVSATYATKTQLNTAKTEIKQTTDTISLEVSQKLDSSSFNQAQIIAQINNSVSSVKIRADNINLSGYLTVSSASSTYASKSSLSAGTTTINGACITTGIIKSSNYSSGTAGTSINLSNGVIDSKNFKINSSGNVTVNGTVTASAGTIGGFTLGSTKLYNGKSTLSANTAGVYIGTDGISLGTGSTFKVTNDGALTATNATISGNITATSGTIGGCSISNGVLTVANANISSINGSKISDNSISSSKISSLSADKISSGTIHGCDLSGGNLTYTNATINGHMQLGPTSTHAYSSFSLGIDGYTGQSFELIVEHEGYMWRKLIFRKGILVSVLSEW